MEEKSDVLFQYQRDPEFVKSLKEAKVLAENVSPEAAGLCWLACIDMAISPYVLEQARRRKITQEIALVSREKGFISDHGGFTPFNKLGWDKVEEIARDFREVMRRNNLDLGLRIIGQPDPYSIPMVLSEEIKKGRSLLVGIAILKGVRSNHVVLMDSITLSDNKAIISIWDPSQKEENAHKILSVPELYKGIREGKYGIAFPIVSVGPMDSDDWIVGEKKFSVFMRPPTRLDLIMYGVDYILRKVTPGFLRRH